MAVPEARLAIVRSLLNNLIGTRSPRHPGTIGGASQMLLRRFWDLPRNDFVNAVVYGQQVIVVVVPGNSALIKSLKGDPPFNGAFDPMPPGGPYMNGADIAFIEQWIADGVPDIDASLKFM
ncbi:MAG: hypothetical protein ACKV0T_15360 [Planctomycetales bacterium]